ncbi:MAG: FkbM family methyltransferase [Roseimicrobium sp.]
MLKLLSFLFRKSRREVFSTVLDLLRKGYSVQDITSLLRTAGDHGWKGSDLRSMQKDIRTFRSDLKKSEEHRQRNEIHAQEELKRLREMQQILEAKVHAPTDKPSLSNLDDKLAPYLNFRGGIFIEAGANDGFAQSNTYYLENSLGWKGMLVEPMPVLAGEARRIRAKSTVFECALVGDKTLTPTVTVHWCNLMSIVEDHHPSPHDIEYHLKSGAEAQGLKEQYQLEVPARTLSSLIDEYNPGREIDFFSLDVEGYETEVLKGLDLTRHKPRRILVETKRLQEVSAMLTPHGYVMEAALSYHDYLFSHESVRE